MQRTFSGAAAGKGAAYAWQGNRRVGEGRMEIAATSPQPSGSATNVTRNRDGPGASLAKVSGVFVSMDKRIGKEFETGLADMKSVAEK